MLTSTNYWQEVNLAFNLPLAVAPQTVICTRLSSGVNPISVQLAAQYSETGDNLNVMAYLQRVVGRPIQAGSCTFSLTEITADGTWSAVNTDTVLGTEDAIGRWVGVIPAGDVITNLCMGKSTLRVKATLQRAGKTFTKDIYVNHLGIGEAMGFFRNKILHIETGKKDE
jgi:hypothetical protein